MGIKLCLYDKINVTKQFYVICRVCEAMLYDKRKCCTYYVHDLGK
jgi:hypothetical protein